MANNFKVNCRRSNGNLHFAPSGTLDGNSAWELIRMVRAKFKGQGNVFIDTRGLTEILPFASRIIRHNLESADLSKSNIIFKGERGYEIAPDNCRVLVVKSGGRCKGNKKCAGCKCGSGGAKVGGCT